MTDEMEALMGFSSFGGGAHRHQRSRPQVHKKRQHDCFSLAEAVHHQRLAQVIPGTELHSTVASERLEQGPHGVTFLVSRRSAPSDADTSSDDSATSLRALLTASPHSAARDGSGTMSKTLLHPKCHELLDELQEEKNRCGKPSTSNGIAHMSSDLTRMCSVCPWISSGSTH